MDESGDPGLTRAAGSSSVFVMVLVLFADDEKAMHADAEISRLKISLGAAAQSEFKFNKMDNSRRLRFLESAAKLDFGYIGLVIEKQKVTPASFVQRDSFYRYACALICDQARPYLQNATLMIDGSGHRVFRRELAAHLKNNTNSKDITHIKKVIFAKSHGNRLIQLADVVAGALYRSYKYEAPDPSFRKIIERREIAVQVWPR